MGALRWAGGRSRSAALIGVLMATTALTAVAASGEPAAQTGRAGERGAMQQPGTTRLAQAAPAQRGFDIPAQPLADALTQFGRQSGMQVSVDAGLIRGISSPGASGSMLPEQALRRLLAGTGIGYRLTGGDTAMLERLPSGGSGVMQLDPVMVEGKRIAPRQAQIDALPAPYAGGQVATGGSVGIFGNRDVMDTP
ncbi:MAG: STN domain-containing protein, partial [Alphaproteobacteria bacterium]